MIFLDLSVCGHAEFYYLCTADLESAGDYFFLAGKTHNGTVQEIFLGG
jgi:hypothetical protein